VLPFHNRFHPQSFSEVNSEHKSKHAAWETPDPGFWTQHEYIIVRADERGLGQSPGLLDTMSRGTSECFFDLVEWAAEQKWSTGKVGLLGISYYAGSQWRVAARQPKGTLIHSFLWLIQAYRDRNEHTLIYSRTGSHNTMGGNVGLLSRQMQVSLIGIRRYLQLHSCNNLTLYRHGGILSSKFIKFWWDRQVVSNQYGLAGKAAREWGPDTIEGDLSEEELLQNRQDQNTDNANNSFRDDPYYASKEYSMEDIKVPLLSVGNWGGILLHLRGNVEGFTHAGSEFKYLRFVSGRHDLPFFYKEEVEVQRGFLDAFLKGDDRVGWSVKGKLPMVDLLLRKGDVPHNNPAAEKAFPRRTENEWPIARTRYTQFHLTPEKSLTTSTPSISLPTKISYRALGTLQNQQLVQFVSEPFKKETEITGHIVTHLNVSVSPDPSGATPSDIDLFLTLRHISPSGNEVFYTGTAGDPVPLCKGWLRVSLRKVDATNPKHRDYLPHRNYYSTDVQPVVQGEVYPVDVEVWPTNVVVEEGGKIVLEISSGDTQGSGMFCHEGVKDRSVEKFGGMNHIHFGPRYENYIVLPIIPSKE